MNTKRSFGYALLSGIALLAALQGCGDDDNGNDKPPVVNPSAGSSGKGSTGGSGTDDGGDGPTPTAGKNSTGGTAGTNTVDPSAGNDAGGQGGDGPVQPTCPLPELGEDGCFNCPKNGDVAQWFNRCVDSDCEPFDNAARLPLLEADGSLPDLP